MVHRNPNLVPKSVVTSRGHTTTVYTRPSAPVADRPELRAAAVPSPVPQPTECPSAAHRPGTPLPPVAERSDAEITEFLNSINVHLPYLGARQDRMLQAPERGAVHLAMDLASSGQLPSPIALHILDSAAIADAATSAAQASDSLRVATRLHQSDDSGYWVYGLRKAAAGNLLRRKEQITTEEDLASSTAVIEYVIAALDWKRSGQLSRTLESVVPDGGPVESYIVPNQHLDQLIRDRPADLHRIMEYVQERGMHHSDPGPVEELRAWLDSGTPSALSPGHL